MNDGYCPRPLTAHGLIETAVAVLATQRGNALNEAWARWLQQESEWVRVNALGWEGRRETLAILAAERGIEI